ncbi:MAG: RNA polymerase sigma factor, partial [Gammaproteobacteria bacterium]|nr:RNA polymerase sigma factor [Gammaproteobacteria bacterium]
MIDRDLLNKLYRYIYTLTGDDDRAYDLLYTSIEKFLKNGHKNNPEAFLKTIIHNQFIDNYRKNQIIQYEEIDETTVTDIDFHSLESIVINEDLTEQIFESLQPDEREILYFWAIEEYSTSEIAIKLEKPKGTILSKLHRMRKKIIKNFSPGIASNAFLISGE